MCSEEPKSPSKPGIYFAAAAFRSFSESCSGCLAGFSSGIPGALPEFFSFRAFRHCFRSSCGNSFEALLGILPEYLRKLFRNSSSWCSGALPRVLPDFFWDFFRNSSGKSSGAFPNSFQIFPGILSKFFREAILLGNLPGFFQELLRSSSGNSSKAFPGILPEFS